MNDTSITEARSKIETFFQRVTEQYCAPNLLFAYYCTFPRVFSVDFLHQLWYNFQTYMQSEQVLVMPHIVVNDLIHSGFCYEVAFELYELDAGVTSVLLKDIDNLLNERRIRPGYELSDIAFFTKSYAEEYYKYSKWTNLFDIYYWKSLFFINPIQANKELHELFHNSSNDQLERSRRARILINLAENQSIYHFDENIEYKHLPAISRYPGKDSIEINDQKLIDILSSITTLEPNYDEFDIQSIKEIEEMLSKKLKKVNMKKILVINDSYSVVNELIVGLNLSGNILDSTSFLTNFPSLLALNLTGCGIRDLLFLNHMPLLEYLVLKDNLIQSSINGKDRNTIFNIYILYSGSVRDQMYLTMLETHIRGLDKHYRVQFFHDEKIQAGSNIIETIRENILLANIFLILLSPELFDFYQKKEQLDWILQTQKRVIPINCRHCVVDDRLAMLKALPDNGKFLYNSPNLDEDIVKIVNIIKEEIEHQNPRR